MSTFLGFVSVASVVLSSYLALAIASSGIVAAGWGNRSLLVLIVPVLGLGLAIGVIVKLGGLSCLLGVPAWLETLGIGLPLAMSALGLGAFALGLTRLVCAEWLAGSGIAANSELAALVAQLATRHGITPPRLLLRLSRRPFAFTLGIRQPTIVLSTWMIEQLDGQELQAVLAHEIAHVVRRDYLVAWLATVLRDAFVYLPPSWMAYRQLQRERELAADELAIRVTDRPLALASALAKVWQEALVGRSSWTLSVPLAGPGAELELRIRRLLDQPPATPVMTNRARLPLVIGGALTGFAGLPLVSTALLVVPVGCTSILRMLGL